MPNASSSHLAGPRDLVIQQWGLARAIGELVVLSLVDRLPPVQRRSRLELETRHCAFNDGRAYEREVLGLPPEQAATGRRDGAGPVAAPAHPVGGAHLHSDRRRHLHLV